jgi:hypothetical protein
MIWTTRRGTDSRLAASERGRRDETMTTTPKGPSSYAAAALLVVLTGCGTSTVVTAETDAPATPYDGPMQVERADEDSPDVMRRGGAAALALECDGEPYNGGGADYLEGDLYELGDTAERALANFLDAEAWAYGLPTEGYRLEREGDSRALFSYDVARRTKVAFVVADGLRNYDDDTGWGVEAWAQCDPAELPDSFSEQADIGVWTDAQGRRVPTTTVKSFQGAEHCDWQEITFIHWREADELVQYVGPGARDFRHLLRSTYDAAAALPDDVRDTGYRRDGRRLWLGADGTAAYLVSVADPTEVERWPAAREPILCA